MRGDRGSWAGAAVAEVALARGVIGNRPAETVFFGGGTPTVLDVEDLERVLRAIGPPPAAEVTVEANPESVDERGLAALREAGFNRISLGMQSAAAHVLATLERSHTPGRAVAAAREARAAGFESVSLDLIYGTPGETDEDWRRSLESAMSAEPDHVSAYALTVEPGTRLAAAVRSGALAAPDEDAQARRYEMADELLTGSGFEWYEISNWARGAGHRSRHNLNYWRGGDWWGVGPGAHSHLDGRRWSNLRLPSAWAKAVAAGRRPVADSEELTAEQRELERLMLSVRLAEGFIAPRGGHAVLTRRGRLLADAVARGL